MTASSAPTPSSGLEAGFTLIEVLVALAIVAVALAAVIRAVGTLTQNNGELRDRTLAMVSAENRLAELHLDSAAARPGLARIDCPQGRLMLVCQQSITAVGGDMREVVIEVYADRERKRRLAALTAVLGTTELQ